MFTWYQCTRVSSASCMDNPDSEMVFYLMLRAVDRFYQQHSRYPGTAKVFLQRIQEHIFVVCLRLVCCHCHFYKGVICSSSVFIYILSHVLLHQECIITRWRRTSASWRSAWTAFCRSTTLTSTSKMTTSMSCKSRLWQDLLNKVTNWPSAIYLFDHFYSLQLSIWCSRATHSCCIFGR